MENKQVQQQVVHQADSNMINNLMQMREKIKEVCSKCVNQRVRIQTFDGFICEGYIVDIKGGCVYVMVSASHPHVHDQRFFSPFFPSGYYDNVILPLVLYELLVITLLYT
ncbi:acetyl-CoA acetyltransferase [Paenibacillus abyssi]|uniref:Uncharacterized protein n=1 Tax=Paenibacillus abyssi TaxID=1340531 RepID=A0A917G4A9_9BACL|nr:acetyl-CoA acetyltransferase [Paenibacillus abyssi]GGG22026.1 hypothetical protein GCM10010916_43360 [Paenibacillus abyssi]